MNEAPKMAQQAARLRKRYDCPKLIKHDKLARLAATASVSSMKPPR